MEVLRRGEFYVEKVTNTFLKIPNGTKGVCWRNSSNIGRYWEVGPQKILYVPAPILNDELNTVEVFELHKLKQPKL